jgi:hypothetical protein
MWQRDKIVLVRGKVDAHGRKPSIICDAVNDNLSLLQPAPEGRAPRSTPPAAVVKEPPSGYRATTAAPQPEPAEAQPIPNGRSTQPAAPASSAQPATPAPATPPTLPARHGAPQPRATFGRSAAPNGDPAPRPAAPGRLHVTIQRTGDGRSDAKRVGDVHRLLRSFEGRDRFVFLVTGGGNGSVELDFPNDTTRICDELLARLRSMVGPQAVQLVE